MEPYDDMSELDAEVARQYRQTNRFMAIGACVLVALVIFGSLWFATGGEVPAPCTTVAIGAQSLTRANGTTSISIDPIQTKCEENQP